MSYTLWVHDDIEFLKPKDFDPPTVQDLERERLTAHMMDLWVQEYNEKMQTERDNWV